MYKLQKERLVFVVPFFLYFIISLFLLKTISFSQHFEIDSPAYTEQVTTYECYGSFIKPGVTTCRHWYGVGYPIFMAAVRALVGHTYTTVIFVQILLGLLLLLLTYRLGFIYFSESVGFIALWFAAINLGFLVFAQYILADLLLTVFLVAAFERLSTYYLQPLSSWTTAWMALFLIAGSLSIKATGFFFLFFCIFELFLYQGQRIQKIAWYCILFALLPYFVLGLYNYYHYGYSSCKGVQSVNLYLFFLPKVLAQAEHSSVARAKQKVETLLSVTEYASGSGWEKAAKLLQQTAFMHPMLCIKVWLTNVLKTFCGLYTNQLKLLFNSKIKGGDCSFFKFSGSVMECAWQYLLFGTDSMWMVGLAIFEALWMLLCFIGIFFSILSMFMRRYWMSLFLLSSYIGYFSMITGCDGCARLRLPFEAVLLILAANGFYQIYFWFFGKKIS